MINCPKCNELIGDRMAVCPFCKTEITDEYRRIVREQNEELHEEAVLDAMAEYSRRLKRQVVVGIITILLIVLVLCAMVLFELGAFFGYAMCGLVLIFYCIVVYIFRIGYCPHCEKYMGGRNVYKEYCPKCGGRLK